VIKLEETYSIIIEKIIDFFLTGQQVFRFGKIEAPNKIHGTDGLIKDVV
jgi:hypothetical protein